MLVTEMCFKVWYFFGGVGAFIDKTSHHSIKQYFVK